MGGGFRIIYWQPTDAYWGKGNHRRLPKLMESATEEGANDDEDRGVKGKSEKKHQKGKAELGQINSETA